jgi:hypothetical protein
LASARLELKQWDHDFPPAAFFHSLLTVMVSFNATELYLSTASLNFIVIEERVAGGSI